MKLAYLLYLFPALTLGQIELQNAVWYFGDHAGLSFDTTPPQVLVDNQITTWTGCASICDSEGMLLLYANKDQARNGQHGLLLNGTGFAYAQALPSPLIVPRPGHPEIFYAVGWQSTFSPPVRRQYLQTFDLSANGGTGAVVQKDEVLRDSVGNGVVAVPHCNGTDLWVVMHDRQNDAFLSYSVTDAGWATTPVVSQAGCFIDFWSMDYDHLQASPDGNRLAYAYKGGQGWEFDIFQFDRCSGIVSGRLPIGSGEQHTVPDFAPNGDLLYVSTTNSVVGDTARLWQYDLSSGDSTLIRNGRQLLEAHVIQVNTVGSSFQCALGPDGKVYVSRDKLACLGVVNYPDTPGLGCDLVACGQDLGGALHDGFLPHQIKFVPAFQSVPDHGGYQGFAMAPNPAIDGLWLQGVPSGSVRVLDLEGRQVAGQQVGQDGTVWLPRQGLSPGVYILLIQDRHGRVEGHQRVLFE